MKNFLILLLFAIAIAFGCKEANDETYPVSYPDFANLKVGNYWIYERFHLDSNGVYTAQGVFDSTYVEKDTLINGLTYYKYMEDQFLTPPGYDAVFLRDSLHYLVNVDGKILFSSQNFNNALWLAYATFNAGNSDTICQIYRKMTDDNAVVSTPAGSFVTKNAQEVYSMYPGFDIGGKIRRLEHRYAENVGLIEETFPFFISDQSKSYTVRRLVYQGHN